MTTYLIPYQNEKIENAIAFFVHEYNKKTKRYLRQTFLYKLLAFFDFEMFTQTGEPALGLTYDAMDHGPVPEEIYKERNFLKSDKYIADQDGSQLVFKSLSKRPNMDYFSPAEVAEMNRLIEIYADSYVKATDISDASHTDILAWKRTYKEQKYSQIAYEKSFKGDIFSRPAKTASEEHFLFSQAIQSAACK